MLERGCPDHWPLKCSSYYTELIANKALGFNHATTSKFLSIESSRPNGRNTWKFGWIKSNVAGHCRRKQCDPGTPVQFHNCHVLLNFDQTFRSFPSWFFIIFHGFFWWDPGMSIHPCRQCCFAGQKYSNNMQVPGFRHSTLRPLTKCKLGKSMTLKTGKRRPKVYIHHFWWKSKVVVA